MTRGQVGRILSGYLLAIIVGSLLVTALMAYTLRVFREEPYTVADYLRAGWDMSLRGVMITFLPSVVLIALAELYRWRNLLIYEAAGVVLPLPLVYGFDAGLIVEMCAIGAAAGLVYWGVAGRTAGA